MKRLICAVISTTLAMIASSTAQESVVCTLAVDVASKTTLIQQGNCDTRISPASTFKIAISLMGFDSGVLIGSDAPEWPFQQGYVDWNPKWRTATTPKSWMRDSVLWFSQRTTEKIGAEKFAAYVTAFHYGNEDVSGDPGKANGLTRAWISSSLQISPAEQIWFISKLISGQLPVSSNAIVQTKGLLVFDDHRTGWQIYGKTGAGAPFDANGALLKGQPFGWYVGWAERGHRQIAFARLVRFSQKPDLAPGIVARDGLIQQLIASRILSE